MRSKSKTQILESINERCIQKQYKEAQARLRSMSTNARKSSKRKKTELKNQQNSQLTLRIIKTARNVQTTFESTINPFLTEHSDVFEQLHSYHNQLAETEVGKKLENDILLNTSNLCVNFYRTNFNVF